MPELLEITSPANPKIKQARTLLRGRKRSSSRRLFAAEGMQLLTRALGTGIDVQFVLMSQDVADLLPVDLAQALDASAALCYRVPGSVFQKVSRRDTASGVVFVANENLAKLADLPDDRPVLVLDRVSNPRNVGAIARTCEAAGLGGLVLSGNHVDPYSYESLRASMGSVFGIVIVGCLEQQMLDWVRSGGRSLVGTSGAAREDLWEAELPSRSAIMFGNEGEGLSEDLIAACDNLIKIPYNTAVDSLNLGAAVAVVSFEYRRRNPF